MSATYKFNPKIQAALSYCMEQVRKYDYHHYLCLLHLPPAVRKAAFVLRAFNVETARAIDVTSSPKTGLMRLLWWQEAVDKIYSNQKIEHPVAQALSVLVSQHKISKNWLRRSVNARISDASRDESDIPKNMGELEQYAEDTQSTVLYMTLQASGFESTTADHVVSHIGKAGGLVLLIRSLPYHASKDRQFCYIPEDVAVKHGLLVEGSRNKILVQPGECLSNAVFEMASVASIHLQKARDLAGKFPAEAFSVMLPAVPAQIFLNSLQKSSFNIFDPQLFRGVLGISPLWYQMKLCWCAWSKKY